MGQTLLQLRGVLTEHPALTISGALLCLAIGIYFGYRHVGPVLLG
jgi:hypothetical protein